jgi:hypothetical protein
LADQEECEDVFSGGDSGGNVTKQYKKETHVSLDDTDRFLGITLIAKTKNRDVYFFYKNIVEYRFHCLKTCSLENEDNKVGSQVLVIPEAFELKVTDNSESIQSLRFVR